MRALLFSPSLPGPRFCITEVRYIEATTGGQGTPAAGTGRDDKQRASGVCRWPAGHVVLSVVLAESEPALVRDVIAEEVVEASRHRTRFRCRAPLRRTASAADVERVLAAVRQPVPVVGDGGVDAAPFRP